MENDNTSTTEELVRELDKSDASMALKRVIALDPANVNARRNSARSEVEKYIDSWDMDLSEQSHYGGGFFSALWDGDIEKAFMHADNDNRRLLKEEFGITEEEFYDRR